MNFEWFVARRYLTARRRQAFISLISGVSIAGVAVGVMALIIALALMTGVQSEMRDRIVGSQAHVYVNKIGPFDSLDKELARVKIPGVAGSAPGIMGKGLLMVSRLEPTPIEIKGIDPALEPDVTDIRRAMTSGALDALTNRSPNDLPGIILGQTLANTLGLKVGEEIGIMSSKLTMNPAAGSLPKIWPFVVVGTAKFDFYPVDTGQVFMSLDAARSLIAVNGPASLIQLRLDNLDDAPQIREALQKELGPSYLVTDWRELNGPLYSALWLEKVAISTTIGLIVMVAALNIVASLVLLVMEKSRDIAILRTMGASARVIRRIFVLQGFTIGLVGTVTGTILGLVVSFIADRGQLLKLDSQVYQITYVPFRVEALDVVIVVAAALAVCLLATVYPSRQAARIDPAEALRNQ